MTVQAVCPAPNWWRSKGVELHEPVREPGCAESPGVVVRGIGLVSWASPHGLARRRHKGFNDPVPPFLEAKAGLSDVVAGKM